MYYPGGCVEYIYIPERPRRPEFHFVIFLPFPLSPVFIVLLRLSSPVETLVKLIKSPKLYLKIYVIFFDEKRIFKNLEVSAFFSNDQKF